MLQNPLLDPYFLPSLKTVGLVLALGFGLVLFFARHDVRAGFRGELGNRYLSWIFITPIFLASVFFEGLVAAIVLLLFFVQCTREYVRVTGVERPYAILLFILIPITMIVAITAPQFFSALPALMIISLTSLPILTGQIENLYLQLTYAGRGYLYLIWSVAHLILLRQIANNGMIISIGVAIALSDVMQYTVGKLFGRHIISPAVNPRKAWEGLAGDFIGACLGVFLFSFAYPPEFSFWHKLGLALLIGFGSAWGDLVSSLVKRAANTKDWGTILPGHGGLLDRANSMIVALPLAYYYLYILGISGSSVTLGKLIEGGL